MMMAMTTNTTWGEACAASLHCHTLKPQYMKTPTTNTSQLLHDVLDSILHPEASEPPTSPPPPQSSLERTFSLGTSQSDWLQDNLLGMLSLVDDLSAGALLPHPAPVPPPEALTWARQAEPDAAPTAQAVSTRYGWRWIIVASAAVAVQTEWTGMCVVHAWT